MKIEGKISLEEKIEEVIKKELPKDAKIGIKFKYLNGKEIYSLNEKELFIPASNVKLVTVAASLKFLGPDYKFKTKIFVDKLHKGKVNTLYIKTKGDPQFTSEDLWLLTNELKILGLKKVEKLVVDNSFFESKFSPGFYENLDEAARPYNAPTSSSSLNYNTIKFYVFPTKIGKAPKVYVFPKFDVEIKNFAITSSIDKIDIKREAYSDVFYVNGKVSTQKVFYRSISNPEKYYLESFKFFLEKNKIKVEKAILGKLKNGARIFYIYESDPLAKIIYDANKSSLNFVCDQILRAMGAEIKGDGSFESGLKVVRNFLEEVGIENYVLVDGSGLSRKNRLSPSQIVKLLEYAINNFEIFPEFVSSLPISGTDGTLKKRFKDTKGEIRAKTGHLNGVSALSGYTKKNEKIVVFSIMVNNFKKKDSNKVESLEEKIYEIIKKI